VDDAVRDAMALIRLNPQIGVHASNVALSGVRRVHLSRIRYHLYYRVRQDPACIEVLALWHTRRGSVPGL
jgi:plasmid stabilization system protein ParE